MKRTKTRVLAGFSGTAPVDDRKTEKIGVAPAVKSTVTELPAVARQAPVDGFDWQMVGVSGKVAAPVSTETTIDAAARGLQPLRARQSTAAIGLARQSIGRGLIGSYPLAGWPVVKPLAP